MQLLPGNMGLSDVLGKNKTPEPKAPPPPPTRGDPEIRAARARQKSALLKRKGRSASILTSALGVGGPANVARPQARLLGE